MQVKSRDEFIKQIQGFHIDTEYAVVKPNWVSNKVGEYTEPEILDWLFEALPRQKKIVVESYTPWRGLKFVEEDRHKGKGVTLEGGKKHWDFYKKQDKHFLEVTGISKVLKKHNADYLNVTNEVWDNTCVEPNLVKELVESKDKPIKWEELYSYIPKQLYDIRNSSTLISLSKIKIEESIPVILISMSAKNLFGLIPHPSRWIPFHGEDHTSIPEVIRDIYTVYTCLFDNTLWIAEGIKTLVRNYCEASQKVTINRNLFFIDKDARKVDSKACVEMGIDPKKVGHLQLL